MGFQNDCVQLIFNFVGWGTDENTIIVILGHRNVHQRQQIRRAYEEIYQEDLVKRLESEIKGDFEVPSVWNDLVSVLCVLLKLMCANEPDETLG